MFTYDPPSQSQTETLGVVNSIGTAVTPNAVANTMGSWVSLGSSTFAYEQIAVQLAGTAAGTAQPYACDIGILGGATYTPILSNWLLTGTGSSGQFTVPIALPIHVPSGAQLGARIQCNSASGAALNISLMGLHAGYGGQPGYSRGFNLANLVNSNGVACTAGGLTNTRAITQITASSLERAEAVMVLARVVTASRGYLYDLSVGSAGNEAALIKDIHQSAFSTTVCLPSPIARISVPAASRLSCNLQASTASSQVFVMPYGFA